MGDRIETAVALTDCPLCGARVWICERFRYGVLGRHREFELERHDVRLRIASAGDLEHWRTSSEDPSEPVMSCPMSHRTVGRGR